MDELTSQILAYAFRSSPKRDDRSWSHGWDATRKKLFDVALAESKIAHGALDEEDRKLPRQERLHRPGLRRVDSMDFLDQSTDGDNVGRTLRLSTSLQNSAKETSVLARSASSECRLVVKTDPSGFTTRRLQQHNHRHTAFTPRQTQASAPAGAAQTVPSEFIATGP